MSSASFENYARLAAFPDADNTEVSGRYSFQRSAERRIISDVIAKLQLSSDDSLLEIGCGPGNLLIPLSHFVGHTAGIDNSASLTRLAGRCGSSLLIDLIPGEFLSMPLPSRLFSKILVYSVVQYMEDSSQATAFLRRGLSLLQPGGRLLLGDLPNLDKKRRFQQSIAGARISTEWKDQVSAASAHPYGSLPVDGKLVSVDDQFSLRLLEYGRLAGFESYLLPQPENLPFGNSREDILFVAPK